MKGFQPTKIFKLSLRNCLPLFLSVLFLTPSYGQGTWSHVVNAAPDYNAGVMLLLTDGTVLAKTSGGSGDVYGINWDRLTPDIHGSYANGTWSVGNPMNLSRLYFSTQMLKDGTIYAAGGEYGEGRAAAERYDPILDNWFALPALAISADTFSDANSEILPDGRVLQAIVSHNGFACDHIVIFDPATNTYSTAPHTLAPTSANESAWVKLPDNSILFVNVGTTVAQRYIPSLNIWKRDADVPVQLYDPYGSETGAGFLLPNGKVFFIGSTPVTAYYTPSGDTSNGTWTVGPIIPDSLGGPDAAASMMIDGKILCALSPTPVLDTVFRSPMVFYEFDYLTDSFTKVGAPGLTLTHDSIDDAAYKSNMLALPDGTVLYATQGTDNYYIYTPSGAPLAAGKPTVNSLIKLDCDTFLATGTLFNGISEGACYGDDWQMATNYPLVRLSRNDSVFYAATYHWNSTGVMRGSQADTTQFVIPHTYPLLGDYSLQVVVNGIASDPVTITICSAAGVNNVANSARIGVFPNPASDMVTVEFDSRTAGEYSVKLQDIYGRVVKMKNATAVVGANTYQLPLDGVKKGIYSITIRTGNETSTTKLIVD